MKLYVIGDSFSEVNRSDIDDKVWVKQLSIYLASVNENFEKTINLSRAGVSQDFIFESIDNQILEKINKDDLLIIVLTHPSRFWFIESQPQLANFINFGGRGLSSLEHEFDSKRLSKAIELFHTEIYRDQLAELHQKHRLGWLSYIFKILQLRKPIILQGFSQNYLNPADWPDLIVSHGNLSDIQANESITPDGWTEWWNHCDLRYNHFCLRNHNILTEKIIESIKTQEPVNLKDGFYSKFIDENSHKDKDFVKKELDIDRCGYWKVI